VEATRETSADLLDLLALAHEVLRLVDQPALAAQALRLVVQPLEVDRAADAVLQVARFKGTLQVVEGGAADRVGGGRTALRVGDEDEERERLVVRRRGDQVEQVTLVEPRVAHDHVKAHVVEQKLRGDRVARVEHRVPVLFQVRARELARRVVRVDQ